MVHKQNQENYEKRKQKEALKRKKMAAEGKILSDHSSEISDVDNPSRGKAPFGGRVSPSNNIARNRDDILIF